MCYNVIPILTYCLQFRWQAIWNDSFSTVHMKHILIRDCLIRKGILIVPDLEELFVFSQALDQNPQHEQKSSPSALFCWGFVVSSASDIQMDQLPFEAKITLGWQDPTAAVLLSSLVTEITTQRWVIAWVFLNWPVIILKCQINRACAITKRV